MYFDIEDEVDPFNFNLIFSRREQSYGLQSDLEFWGLRNVPTHTEDGIPIRKLYISNLPPKTTRAELFAVFAQFGFIRSCWMKMGDKGPNKVPAPTYAFVTFSDPADAHKALLAPVHEKTLRGRNLRISPADSWHQPVDDGPIKSNRKAKVSHKAGHEANKDMEQLQQETDKQTLDDISTSSNHRATNDEGVNEDTEQIAESQAVGELAVKEEIEEEYTILDVLNRDCLHHIYSFVPIRDLIRSERVSKEWQNSVQEYLDGVRVFKTSWWQHVGVALTTATLRRLLRRLRALLRLHVDHHWSALNDRTAHTIGKFCPHLEEIKIVGMHTKNWNPLIYACKSLRIVTFISCNKLTDISLVQTVKRESCVESITIANNTHVTGLFLTGAQPPKLTSLSFYNCYSLQGTVLNAALENIPNLKCLKLDVCPGAMWKIVPLILQKLPQLEELSLSEYMTVDSSYNMDMQNMFIDALATLSHLKTLNLSRNVYITDDVLKKVAQSCSELESLNISGCNPRKNFPHSASSAVRSGWSVCKGVSDEGVGAVSGACGALRRLDVSYLRALSDAGLATAARLTRLATLVARGNPALSADPFVALLDACHQLQEVDACGCDGVTPEVVTAAARALSRRPRALALHLAATAAAHTLLESEYPTHKLLTLNMDEDRSNSHLRPDFVDHMYDHSSDDADSLNDMFDAEDLEDFLGHDDDDDDFFLDDDAEEFEALHFASLHLASMLL